MTHATPTELLARALGLEKEARWAEGRDYMDLREQAALLRKLAGEAMASGVLEAANDNAPAMPASRGKEVVA